jgi:hypothetical protein
MTSQFAHCRTLSDFKTVPNSRRNPRRPHLPSLDTAFLTFYDYERIKKNAFIPSREESLNNERIQKEQKDTQLAKARALKDKIQKYDKNKPKYFLSEIEREKIINDRNLLLKAQKYRDDNEDVVKEMEKLAFYAKVATIRDKQKQEHIIMEQNHKRKEEKLDMMMELERLKELKNQQDKERMMQKQRKEGCMIIIEQMKKKKLEQIKLKEQLDKEKKDILKYLKKLEDEEQIENEKKKILREKISQEIVESNRISALNKQKKLAQEKEEDLKILKYNMEKAKREEEELKRKKKIQEQKEKEVQKLREKQEKAQDNQEILDEIRAKRSFDEASMKERKKQQEELLLKEKRLKDLIMANNRQKLDKELQLAEEAKKEKEEFERIIKEHQKEVDDMKERERIKIRKLLDHNADLKRQIVEKEEKERVNRREVLEEGRKNQQKRDEYEKSFEALRRDKIQYLRDMNIDEKYIVPLRKFNLKDLSKF